MGYRVLIADDENEIRDQIGQAAVAGDHDGETPDVSHADGRTDAGQNKAPAARKGVAADTLLAHKLASVIIE